MTPLFITGGTGFTGRRLIKQLVARGHDVTVLVRKGSEGKLPPGVRAIIADPFDAASFVEWIKPGSVFVQLLGVAHPSPAKKEQFKQVDLRSLQASADAAATAGVSHFVYVSVAMTPFKLMKEFQAARSEGEAYLATKRFPCTVIRPWYVLGPGHWWPVVLLPFYAIAGFKREWKQKADAFSFVTIRQMIATLLNVLPAPTQKLRVLEIRHIKKQGRLLTAV